MGYDVHITRAHDWTESESKPIALDEWLDYVRRDPEMRLDGVAEVVSGDASLRYESAGLAVWTAYSGNEPGGNQAWFAFVEDHVVVKRPDREILGKMRQVAEALSAIVQGDDGEVYDAEAFDDAPPGSSAAKDERARTGWFGRLFRRRS